jgi:hypothetical protein
MYNIQMKAILKILVCVSLPFTFPLALHAQQVVTDDFDRLEVHYQTPALAVDTKPLDGTKAITLSLAGYDEGGLVGSPSLPMRTDIIVVPFCDSIAVEVTHATYDTLQLSPFTSHLSPFYPLQPSRSKSDTAMRPATIDADRYATDALWGMPMARVEVLGIARDRRLARLTFSPVQVNPVSGLVVVCRSADIVVRYLGSDAQATQDHFDRYYSPAFSFGNTLNTLVNTKDVRSTGVKRMIVVLGRNLGEGGRLADFINWKRRLGFRVDLWHFSDYGSNTALANALKQLYEEGDDNGPVPNYVLLVGDHSQLPAFNSRLSNSSVDNDHITDLYYASWTNDNVPDCYLGRFSATDTNTLNTIIAKSMFYESYSFSDDSYLSRAALIAGEDNGWHSDSYDNAWRYADPSMDYIAKTYVNAANGYDSVVYYKNNTEHAPEGVTVTGYCSDSETPDALRRFYDFGAGWINYSAHGDWDEWTKPRFKVSHANSMNNVNKPSFMIGNCCLTNKFEKNVCLGEALLRRANNAGAVAYIGGTNYTYWVQDFHWSVGVRSNISNAMDATYSPAHLGAYDRLFHTHGEDYTDFSITAGAILMAGNLSVASASTTSTDMIKYYWEVYELMGDPSLVPWLGRARDLEVSGRIIEHDATVTSEPRAYVAFIDSVTLDVVYARFLPASGTANITLPDTVDIHRLLLAVTAQNRKPLITTLADSPLAINTSHLSPLTFNLYPNPSSGNVTIAVDTPAEVSIVDIYGRVIAPETTVSNLSPFTTHLTPGLYLVRLRTADGIAVKKLIVN